MSLILIVTERENNGGHYVTEYYGVGYAKLCLNKKIKNII